MNIAIIGKGNLGSHLYEGLKAHAQIQWFGRQFPARIEADVVLVAVPDTEVPEVCGATGGTLVAHTAGAVALQKGPRCGVFYPLYSFTKGAQVQWSEVPFLVEAEREEDVAVLKKLATILTDKIYEVKTEGRQHLHAAAVMVNNFTNHLYTLASEHCAEKDVPFEVLHPIMKQGPGKAIASSPKQAQTGPAVRGDVQTLERHLATISDPEVKELYRLLSKSIQKTHEL